MRDAWEGFYPKLPVFLRGNEKNKNHYHFLTEGLKNTHVVAWCHFEMSLQIPFSVPSTFSQRPRSSAASSSLLGIGNRPFSFSKRCRAWKPTWSCAGRSNLAQSDMTGSPKSTRHSAKDRKDIVLGILTWSMLGRSHTEGIVLLQISKGEKQNFWPPIMLGSPSRALASMSPAVAHLGPFWAAIP